MKLIATLKSVLDKGMVNVRNARNWGELVSYAGELERQGYDVEVAPWSDEGPIAGYSLYVDKSWELKEELAHLDRLLEGVPARRQEAYGRYLNELMVINRHEEEYRNRRSEILFQMKG